MTREEHLLTIAVEECAEVAQRLTKALRFGIEEVQATASHGVTSGSPEEFKNNRDRIYQEFYDLRAVLGMCGIDAWVNNAESKAAEAAKVAKVERFLNFSAECGTLHRGL